MGLEIELQAISSGYDQEVCWVHARPGTIPGDPPIVIVTMQKLRLSGVDVFYALNEMRTDDGGETWTGPIEHADTLGRRPVEEGMEDALCDFTPAWHAETGVLLGTGHTTRYLNDDNPPGSFPQGAAYSVYDRAARTWTPWRKLELPDPDKFYMASAGCTQRVDLPDGDILLPTYFKLRDTVVDKFSAQHVSVVMRRAFDGETLTYIEHGVEFTLGTGRGYVEPSLAMFNDRFFLTLRNDDHGAVTWGRDGVHFEKPRLWSFDDGSDLGSYNTQQHWVTMPDALYLAYTRRGANNDHVFRHRAPLFIAQVDPDRLYVLRDTEQILVPERGAGLGNFGVTRVSDRESWVSVAEWMQAPAPYHHDCTVCERYGSDNSVFVAKIRG